MACILIACAAMAAPIRFQAAQPIAAVCEVTALQFHLSDGSVREERLDPPVHVTSTVTRREVAQPPSAKSMSVEARGCRGDRVTLGTGTDGIVIRVWPLATLAATFEGAKPDASSVVHAAFVDVAASETDELQQVSCVLEKSIARCRLPALRALHLRVEWNGFAPVYAKNVSPRENGTVDLVGVLSPAFRVEGRVVTRDGRPIRDARVRLLPSAAGHLTKSERSIRTRVASSDAKGWYQIGGVAPGVYRLVSEVPGYADAVIASLQVTDANVRAAQLVHTPPARLQVLLSPPVAPDGSPWRVTLTRRGTRQHEVVVVSEGIASPAGLWTSEPLQNADYTVTIASLAGSEVAEKEIAIGGDDERLLIIVSGIAVRGRLLSADEGVAGSLTFFNAAGQRVRAAAGPDGTFTTVFPAAGAWRPEVIPPDTGSARIILPDVKIQESSTDELLLRLPGARISGIVLDAQRRAARAGVVVRRDGKMVANAVATADGKFTIPHLEKGLHMIEASAPTGFAPPQPIDLTHQDQAEVELVLAPKYVVQGVVVAASGRRLSGAIVRVVEAAGGRWNDTVADAEGLFSADVKTSGPVDLIVFAPPAPVVARRVSPAQGQAQPVTIVVPPVGATLRVGLLRVPPWPVITAADGAARYLGSYVMPRFGVAAGHNVVDGLFQFTIEPGTYTVCLADDCRSVVLQPGASGTVDFVSPPERR